MTNRELVKRITKVDHDNYNMSVACMREIEILRRNLMAGFILRDRLDKIEVRVKALTKLLKAKK